MRTFLAAFSAAILLLQGCSWGPKAVILPSGEVRKPINDQSEIADVMGRYYRTQKEARARSEAPKALTKMPIKKVLEQYVPADFTVYADSSVDLMSTVDYEAARPWPEAFGDALAEVDVDMTADLAKRVMTLKTAQLTVAQVLSKYVPKEYTVFADDSVNMGALVTFDRAITWTEALGTSLSSVGINSTTNFRKKLVLLKSKTQAPKPSINPAAPGNPTSTPAAKPSPL